jgi:hypothetical protein
MHHILRYVFVWQVANKEVPSVTIYHYRWGIRNVILSLPQRSTVSPERFRSLDNDGNFSRWSMRWNVI